MLELKQVVTGYGKLAIIDRLDLSVQAGSVTGLIGANGAGKTTTVSAIAGVLPVTNGEIRFLGERIDRLTPDRICARGISLVPQSRELFPNMTVYENLEIAGIAVDRGPLAPRIDNVVKRFPRLAERGAQRASSLSGGEQQMLVIARALMAEPRLLLLDEPTTGLAPLVIEELHRIIAGLASAGQTILLVEQNIRLVMSLADRVYVMRKGQIVYQGLASELAASGKLSAYYLH
jgi:branched-chain amino acid transport system ATP-binding protein